MAKTNRYWQLIENREEDSADLYIFGDITSWPWGEADVSADSIVHALQNLTQKNINVHINSYGGEVKEGLAIFNVLKNSEAHVKTICDGFACSAASVVFMAGDERIMNAASLLMIHNAWTVAAGDAEDLRKAADDIETVTQASVEAYKLRATISEEEIKALMNADSWILPEDALEMGFATAIEEDPDDGTPKQNAFKPIMEALIAPQQARKKKADPKPEPEPDSKEEPEQPAEPDPVPEPAKKTVVLNSWDNFFKN